MAASWIVLGGAVLVASGTLLRPLGQDASAHIAGLHQAVVSDHGLAQAFTFRGPSYNGVLGVLYLVASSIVDFFDRSRFDPAVIGLVVLTSGAAAWAWARGLAARFSLDDWGTRIAFSMALLACTSNIETVMLHPEHVAVVVTFGAWGLASARARRAWLVAGCLLATLPLMKGITAVYMAPVLLSALLQSGWRSARVRELLVVSLGGAVLLVVASALVVPLQLRDLVEAAAYQDALSAPLAARFTEFGREVADYLVFNPLIVAGLLALVVHLAEILRRRDAGEALLVVGLWSIAPIGLLLQQQYFTYHGTPAVLAASYSVVAVATWSRPVAWNRARSWSVGGVLLVLGLVLGNAVVARLPPSPVTAAAVTVTAATVALVISALTAPRSGRTTGMASLPKWAALALLVPTFMTYAASPRLMPTPGRVAEAWQRASVQESGFEALAERYDLQGQEILLLAFPEGTRHLDVRSACRYWFPIPVQRYRDGERERFDALAGFRDNLACISGYDGEYLIQERDWFRMSKLPETRALDAQYERIDEVTIGPRSYFVARRRATGAEPARR